MPASAQAAGCTIKRFIKFIDMKANALSVANYFIGLAKKEHKEIRLLGLIKRVYIAHGFSLALQDKGLLDPRFDSVEAWKYGPVIPSVYHSFKQYKHNNIDKETDIMEWDEIENAPVFITPELKDENAKKVVEMVWRRYHSFTDSELVSLSHKVGSPWFWKYTPGKNVIIPDSLIKIYYKKVVDNALKTKKNGETD